MMNQYISLLLSVLGEIRWRRKKKEEKVEVEKEEGDEEEEKGVGCWRGRMRRRRLHKNHPELVLVDNYALEVG